MQILMLSWEFPPNVVGGLGKHVGDLVPALARQGMGVHVLTPCKSGAGAELLDSGVWVHRVAYATDAIAFYDRAMAANMALEAAGQELIAGRGPYDILHDHDWLTAPAAIALKHAHRLPLVATVHATERGRGRGVLASADARRIDALEWRLTYEAWRVIVCAHYMASEIGTYFATPADKVDVVPNGVDPSQFDALVGEDLSEFRARFALPEEKIVFYVGRIVAEKGVDVLIAAAPRVLDEYPQAKFVIAGKGPELDNLRTLVERLHLADKVLLTGFISDAERNRLFRVADCAVFPSLYEPFGIVALEAMAAEVPVVVSEVGGLKEVVQHAETGITIYPNSPESCAWGILHTLQHPHWAARRVENARRIVRTVYSWDTIAAQTEDVYRRVVDERSRTEW